MYLLLKRLELQGFKSFADKTVLDFMDGTTAVVGPNGSGKSNISDAIRWVIGETSAKSLRGLNMQDVIFAGTQTRKALNYAEVSLILDNSKHDFNSDYEEVVVTRRLFRSGESVYQINKTNCRLKDVHELFMDTGLGRDGYSIIGQGNVSQILSNKPEDRRALFEEAASVSKYKYKKEEAIRKLTHVDENLVRIGDISTELESQIEPLKKQSIKARRYLELYGDMKQLDINLSIIALDRNKQHISEMERLYNHTENELKDIHSKESENERIMNNLYDESKRSDEEKTEVSESLVKSQTRITETKNEINILENNIKNNKNNIMRMHSEIVVIEDNNKKREKLISETKNVINEKTKLISTITYDLSNSRIVMEKYGFKLDEMDKKISELRSEYFARENDIASENERVNGIEALRNSFIERREAVNAEINSFKEGIEQTKAEIKQTDEEIFFKENKLAEMSETLTELKSAKEKSEKDLQFMNEKLSTIQVEYNSKSSKKRILEGLENDYAGYAKSVKNVLTSPELKKLAIYGTISGLIDVNPKYVTAIETALGGALQNIIVESEEDAKAAIIYLRRTGGGRATFLPVSSVTGRILENSNQISKSNGFIGIASELIIYDKKYDGIIHSLLGRVVVVDNIDNAVSLSRKFKYRFKTVTLDGDVLNAGGSMSGGSVNKQSGFLSRAAEVKTLTAEISSLIRDEKKMREDRDAIKKDTERITGQLSSFVPLIRECEDDIIRLKNTRQMLKETLSKSESSSYETELFQIEANLKESAEDVAKLIAHISSLKTNNKKVEEEIQRLFDTRNEISKSKNAVSEQSSVMTEKIAEINKDIAVGRQTISSAKNETVNACAEIEIRRNSINEIERMNDAYTEEIFKKNKLMQNSEQLTNEIREKLSTIDEHKKEISERMKYYTGTNKDITKRIIELQKEIARIENKRIRLETERDNILNRIWDDYELGYNAALGMITDVDDEKVAIEKLGELRKQIKTLGSVNMDSIEEYKTVKERYEFMTKQKVDLEKSKDNLMKIIDSMEDLMKEHFSEQFTEINKAFSEVFVELFGGGIGKLYLSDPNDVLNSGIEIEVQLPGKGLQNLNLYSGGEKSFIAITLLFAILKVKPTPFCILDEIDAALDDVNVSRFATYLKNYTDTTQFIIITHRRGSMEAASILYGVTMQESGVSKLLSLKIDDVSDDLIE